MEEHENVPLPEKTSSGIQQHEDAVLKISAEFFRDEVIPCLGIEGTPIAIAPTELLHLELQKRYLDFNYVMEDESWSHFEFQSTPVTLADMRRFRLYDALIGIQYGVSITTYVLFSGNIKNPMTELTEGMNTYRIVPIVMQNKNADEVLATLQQKLETHEAVTKADLLPLVLSPLMGGQTTLSERIVTAFRITRQVTTITKHEIQKVEAMMYAMADKFLDDADMEQLKKEIRMTRLGQMLYEDAKAEGKTEGKTEGIAEEREHGIRIVIKLCRQSGWSQESTAQSISKEYDKTLDESFLLVQKYWTNL